MYICAYIDLNPVAAGIVEVPEASPHTSVTTRVEHVKAQGRTSDLKAAERGSVAGSTASAGLEETIWLCPVEDRRKLDSSREGMVEGLPLGSYLLLVDYTGRLFREGKSAISAELAGILARLGTSAEGWQVRLEKLRGGRLLGRFCAGQSQALLSRERKATIEVATRLGVHHLANLGGCPARSPKRSDADSRPRPSARRRVAAADRRPPLRTCDWPIDSAQLPLPFLSVARSRVPRWDRRSQAEPRRRPPRLIGLIGRIGQIGQIRRGGRMAQLKGGRLLGRFLADSRKHVLSRSERRRLRSPRARAHHLANLGGCPAR